MGDYAHCSCTDLSCPVHPANHDKGCVPCVQKNLRQGEIPSCFFRKVRDDISGVSDFTMRGFVRWMEENEG